MNYCRRARRRSLAMLPLMFVRMILISEASAAAFTGSISRRTFFVSSPTTSNKNNVHSLIGSPPPSCLTISNHPSNSLSRKNRWITLLAATPNDSSSSKEERDKEEEQDNIMFDTDGFFAGIGEDNSSSSLTNDKIQKLTVPQLKQQLRLRGLKVSGRKGELIDRLLDFQGILLHNDSEDDDDNHKQDSVMEVDVMEGAEVNEQKSKARRLAEKNGKELIDVTAYLDEEDKGKATRSLNNNQDQNEEDEDTLHQEGDDDDGNNDDGGTGIGPEVWGLDAKIVDDYEGRSVVVDSLSRLNVEFTGSNQTKVNAYVVASRDALRYFLAGGSQAQNGTSTAEDQLREIQMRRERAAKVPSRLEDNAGVDEGDETGLYKNIIERDFSDWGKFTQTGVQLSASEVQGVLLLSDVYGAFSDDTMALAEKIAFECQPVVVMVPDLFRNSPWKEEKSTPGLNAKGQSYEEWRAQHSDLRVSIDIRAAAACLRERYGVSSVTVWGTCYGGGRALEAASGYLPDGNIHDVDGRIGPPLVDPMAAIAWYPTRYDATKLFGPKHKGSTFDVNGNKRQVAVMTVFAGEDILPGATPEDAAKLKSLLEQDNRVNDQMVKVFPDVQHGFAHIGLTAPETEEEPDSFGKFVDGEFGGAGKVTLDSGDADVACLLSTAWMETYSRVFLPTTGPAVSKDDNEEEWQKLEMKDVSPETSRDVRGEMEDALDNFVEEPLGGRRIDQTDESQKEELAKILIGMQDENEVGPYTIEPDDDLTTIYAKLKASDENFQIF